MFRKMVLTGIMVFAPRNPSIRAALCLVVCIVAQVNLNYFRPYRSNLVFWVEQAAYSMAAMMYISSILFLNNMSVKQEIALGLALIVTNVAFWLFAFWAVITKLELLRRYLVNAKNTETDETAGVAGEKVQPELSRTSTFGGGRHASFRDAALGAVHLAKGLENMKAHEASTVERAKRVHLKKTQSSLRLDRRKQERAGMLSGSSKTAVVSSVVVVPMPSSSASGEGVDKLIEDLRAKLKNTKKIGKVFAKIDKDQNSMLSEKEFLKMRKLLSAPLPEKEIMHQLWVQMSGGKEEIDSATLTAFIFR